MVFVKDTTEGKIEMALTLSTKPAGMLAYEITGERLPLQILHCERGYYIGTADEDGPVSRESLEYWKSGEFAHIAFKNNAWTQRDEP